MKFEGWYLLLGGLMLAITFLDRHVRRLPITTTLLYLVTGLVLGPIGFGILRIDPIEKSAFLERATELGVIISLFTAGLKLQAPLLEKRWWIPLRLASLSMFITIGLVTIVGVTLLELPLGGAILLGAILAPTDPVLASDVQLEHPQDRDRMRFALTGEAGLNDGTAFPFVMLGLGLLGLHEIGPAGFRWLAIDCVWAIAGGLMIGGLSGALAARRIRTLRERNEETLSRDEFIALGLIAFSYGVAIYAHTYVFLAVFAAGLTLRQRDPAREEDKSKVAAPVLGANEQLEHVCEIGLVLMLGGMLSSDFFSYQILWFAPLLFLVIRPVAVALGTIRCTATPVQRSLLAWFGIRGIGSMYYLMYAVQHGVPKELAQTLCSLVLAIVTISIVVHGISVTPIMKKYEARKKAVTP